MNQSGTKSTLRYRKDLDGLRAVAVLAVTIFHLGFQQMEGGFIGVDVFFVISGFLVTAIIESKYRDNTFTFLQFYARRIRRLIPAALVTIVGTFTLATMIMTPDDFIAFGQSAIAATLSISNILFFFEAGYWDGSSEMKPLLHTWSLGVEEQFYLIWPVILLFVFKYVRKWAGIFFFLISGLGLIAAEIMQTYSPSAAFYLFPFRIFEFSLGALVIYIGRTKFWILCAASPSMRNSLNLLGITLILASFFTYDGSIPFPGVYALPPIVGTMLVLLSGTGNTSSLSNSVILANPLMNWLGKASYSIYLVHWPIITMFRYKHGPELTLLDQLGLSIVILITATALHYGIENRFRFPNKSHNLNQSNTPKDSYLFLFLTLIACAVITPSVHTIYNSGWKWRFPEIIFTPEMIDAGMDKRFEKIRAGCRIDQIGTKQGCSLTNKIKVLVFGNSHEPDGYNFLSAGYEDNPDVAFYYFGTINQCKDITQQNDSWSSSSSRCKNRMDLLFDENVGDQFDTIVYSSYKPLGSNKNTSVSILETLKLRRPDRRILILGGFISTKTPCARLINESKNYTSCADEKHVNYFEKTIPTNNTVKRLIDISDSYIDRVGLLCQDRDLSRCLTKTPQNNPIMFDNHHQSLEFAEHTGRLYAETEPSLFESPVGWPVD